MIYSTIFIFKYIFEKEHLYLRGTELEKDKEKELFSASSLPKCLGAGN